MCVFWLRDSFFNIVNQYVVQKNVEHKAVRIKASVIYGSIMLDHFDHSLC